jgi:outer membrane receptor protein involved in Fe transport
MKNLQVYVKVDNVLDRSPPDYAFAAFQAGLFSIYDVIGRNYKVGIKASL